MFRVKRNLPCTDKLRCAPAPLPAPLPGGGNYAIIKIEFCLPQSRGRRPLTGRNPAFPGPGRVGERVEPVSGAAKLIET
jgi:hypothetical protein